MARLLLFSGVIFIHFKTLCADRAISTAARLTVFGASGRIGKGESKIQQTNLAEAQTFR